MVRASSGDVEKNRLAALLLGEAEDEFSVARMIQLNTAHMRGRRCTGFTCSDDDRCTSSVIGPGASSIMISSHAGGGLSAREKECLRFLEETLREEEVADAGFESSLEAKLNSDRICAFSA